MSSFATYTSTFGRFVRLPRVRPAILRLAGVKALHSLVILSLLLVPSWGAIAPAPDPTRAQQAMNGVVAADHAGQSDPATQPAAALPSHLAEQSAGGRLWAGTNNAGVWLYENGIWTQRSNGLGNIEVHSLQVNPFDHNVLLAVTPGGVYRTSDSGQNWLTSTMPFTQTGWNTVFWDRANPGEVVISGPELGTIFHTDPHAAVSSDGGASWTGIDLDVSGVAEARPGDVWGFAGQWYMIVNSGISQQLGWNCDHRRAFWRSSDHGRTWQLLCTWPSEYLDLDRHVTGLWRDPLHIFGTFYLPVANPIIESTDGGSHWSPGSLYLGSNTQILADPIRDGTLWLIAQGSLYRSSSGVNGFQLLFGPSSAVAVDGYNGGVYTGWRNRTMAYSLDGGETWTSADLPRVGPVTDNTHILALAAELPAQRQLTPDPVTPNNWTMVLSLRPTLRWGGVPQADRYSLSIFHYSEEEGKVGDLVKLLVLAARDTRDPERLGYHRYKLDFDLKSGTTPVEAGYVWKIEALDSAGNVLSSSLPSVFQIPSLGGTWGDVKGKGLCTGYVVNGKRKTAPCNFPYGDNEYWNEYDDMIYRWSERWDLPPAIMKAIMIGETNSAIGPRDVGCWRKPCPTFPPDQAYGYEPYWDYVQYRWNERYYRGIEHNPLIADFVLPNNPPTNQFEGLGPYNFPYSRTVASGTTIYRYATGIGYPFSVPNVTDIPGCEDPESDNCPARQYIAQYRVHASYGLGQSLYFDLAHDLNYCYYYDDVHKKCPFLDFLRPWNRPTKFPPEELYKPDVEVNVMGFELLEKRCQNEGTSELGARDTKYEVWEPVLLRYNGGSTKFYGHMVSERAYSFTVPTSAAPPGWQPETQFEATRHNCQNLFGQTVETTSAAKPLRSPPSTEIELDSGAIDLRGDGSQVWVTLSALQDSTLNSYKGIIRIFSDETRETLLWSSPWIDNINPVAAFRTSSADGYPLLLVDWGSGMHAIRTYPVQWNGAGFRLVPTLDLQGAPTDGFGSDGGGVFFSRGSLVSLQQTYEAANQRRVFEWSYGPSGFQQVRTYLIDWDITSFNIYLPFITK